ncbi:MAG: hypothetical protein ABJN35_11255 [Erythrobacter sp.]
MSFGPVSSRGKALRDKQDCERYTCVMTILTMTTPRPIILASIAPALFLTGCEEPTAVAPDPAPQSEFFAALSTHCGKAYSGSLVSADEVDADFIDAELVMYVSECSEDRIAVPFHVKLDGQEWDRSRTWLITRTEDGLRLKHDHRHEDGEDDAVTMYGGDTADAGSAGAQSFPVDQFSIDMFEREGLTASVTNVWTVEVDPAGTEVARYVYQLKRTIEGGAPEERLFRVEFDLNQEVEAPPAAWGWE